ncbi:MAG: hypothetical protein ABSA85_12900 [Terracidiphilus sp.]
MKSGLRAFLFFLAALSLSSVARATTSSWSYENRDIFSSGFHIGSACMMPVEGSLTKIGMKGGESMASAVDTWNTTLQALVEKHFTTAGVQLLSASSALSSGASDDELRQVLLEVKQKYDTIATQLDKKPKSIGKERYTLGDEVALLPCSAKSDVLVFVQAEGDVLTNGKKAMGWLVTGQAFSTATLVLTMADTKTGEILAFVRLTDVGNFLDDAEKSFGKSLDHQIKRLKIGTIEVEAENTDH